MLTRGKPRGGIVRSILDITVGRLLKWIVRAGADRRRAGRHRIRAVRLRAGESDSVAGKSRRLRLSRSGLGHDGRVERSANLLLHGAGHVAAAGRADRAVALRLVRESGDAARCRSASPMPDHMRRYRFIVDPKPTPANPDQLPVGFTRHFDAALGQYVLDLTCSACHTGELHAQKDGKTYAIRIDGGQAMHAFTSMQRGAFGPTLVASMIATWSNPWKFDRFAKQGDRRALSARQVATACGFVGDDQGVRDARAELAVPASVSGAGRIRTHRCARPHRRHGVRRSPDRRRIIRKRMRRSAIRICGTSGSSTGCSTTVRSASRWRATSANRSASAR